MSYQPADRQNVPYQPYQGGYPQQLGGGFAAPPPGPPPRRKTGKIIGFGILGVFLLLVIGIGSIFVKNTLNRHDVTPEEEYATSTKAVCDSMNKAIKAKDEKAFLASFEGEQLKAQQQKLFRNLIKVPFQVARFEAYPHGSHDSGEVPVAFVHQVKGADAAPVAEQYTFTFKYEPGHRQVISDAKGSVEPYPGTHGTFYPAPWDVYNDMTVVQKGRVVLISDKQHAADTERFAPYISQAADDDVAAWKRSGADSSKVSKGALIVLEPNRKVYTQFYRVGAKDDSLEAGVNMPIDKFTFGVGEESKEAGGSRIVMDSSLSRFTSPSWKEGVKEISRHEIAHAMVAVYDQARVLVEVDSWVSEGFAGYMESRDNPAAAKVEAARTLKGYEFNPSVYPVDDAETFYAKTARERSANYTLARLAIEYMAKKYGEKNAFEFVIAEYVAPTKSEESFRKYLGVDRQTFMEGWQKYVSNQVPGMSQG
ncbi:hypothetical protein ACFU7T_17280 [Streptomyces sp. NPDC057555]|uniref:hypothetical protein n=1 Tax=Streptomyces sp. NPDC057555 TaxID=3346166 RepID=UPI003676BDB5